MAYTSKALISARGTLAIKVHIRDRLGNESTQTGYAHEVMRGDYNIRLRTAMERAITNAMYKHFESHGYQLVQTHDKNTYERASSSIDEITIKDAQITYYGEATANYTFKRESVNGEWRSNTYRNGELLKSETYMPISTELLQEELDKTSFGMKGVLRKKTPFATK